MANVSVRRNWEPPVTGRAYPTDDAVRAVASDEWMEKLSWLMDRSIPLGGKYAIGLDGFLGLIPGLGDVASGLVGATIVFRAHRMGVPRSTVLRMVANIGIDSAVGSIPILGDLFDFAWQANTKNMELYRQALSGAATPRRDAWFIAIVLLSIAFIVMMPLMLLFWLAGKLW